MSQGAAGEKTLGLGRHKTLISLTNYIHPGPNITTNYFLPFLRAAGTGAGASFRLPPLGAAAGACLAPLGAEPRTQEPACAPSPQKASVRRVAAVELEAAELGLCCACFPSKAAAQRLAAVVAQQLKPCACYPQREAALEVTSRATQSGPP